MSKITSWVSNEDGSVVESDIRLYAYKDGSYDIEAQNESTGILLGLDNVTKSYTIIVKIEKNAR
jgi:hypothetical protein